MSHSLKFSSPIFTDIQKMYLAYALTVAYLPKFSSPITFACQNFFHQIFPVLWYYTHALPMYSVQCLLSTVSFADHLKSWLSNVNYKTQDYSSYTVNPVWLQSTIHRKILIGEKLVNMANHELFAKIFLTNIHRYTAYLAYALTVDYLPNFSLPIAFTCMVRHNFPLPNISHVRYYIIIAMYSVMKENLVTLWEGPLAVVGCWYNTGIAVEIVTFQNSISISKFFSDSWGWAVIV